MDEPDEKAYSDQDMDDDHSSANNNNNKSNNNFMNQVHRQRRQSLSYSKQEAADIDINDDHNDSEEYTKPKTPSLSSQYMSHSINPSNFLKPQTEPKESQSTSSKTHKPQRRHSADKILSKPSTKNTNSADHLNRMVISLRAKIATYKEDLRIAGELGQNLFSQNAKKDGIIQQYQIDMDKLKLINEELLRAKKQLLQTSELDAEHTKRLETYGIYILCKDMHCALIAQSHIYSFLYIFRLHFVETQN